MKDTVMVVKRGDCPFNDKFLMAQRYDHIHWSWAPHAHHPPEIGRLGGRSCKVVVCWTTSTHIPRITAQHKHCVSVPLLTDHMQSEDTITL